jgi:glyoxalase-like protein
MLELDHVFCIVPPAGDWLTRLSEAGWQPDEGTSHPGQGTRNRRLVFSGQYLELVWVENPAEARANPLRLDRRAEWAATGASPFGVGLRGRLTGEQREAFWLYEDLGVPLWIHRDNERCPERPLTFVLDLPERRRRGEVGSCVSLRAVHHRGPAPAEVPPYQGPPLLHHPGAHRLDMVVDAGHPVVVTDLLSILVAAQPRSRSTSTVG